MKPWIAALGAGVIGTALLWFLNPREEPVKEKEPNDDQVDVLRYFEGLNEHSQTYEDVAKTHVLGMHLRHVELLKSQANFNGLPDTLYYNFGRCFWSVDIASGSITKMHIKHPETEVTRVKIFHCDYVGD